MNPFFAQYEEKLALRGFTYGGGRISTDKKHFYINIPKNASSYLDQLFSANGWEIANTLQDNLNTVTPIIVLRDPVDRWVSGITQYLNSFILNGDSHYSGTEFVNNYNEVVERLLFDQVIVDDHTMPQYYFIHGLTQKCNYHKFSPELVQQLKQQYNLTEIDAYANRNEDNSDKQVVSQFIQQRLAQAPHLLDKIKNAYTQDYALINQATFQ